MMPLPDKNENVDGGHAVMAVVMRILKDSESRKQKDIDYRRITDPKFLGGAQWGEKDMDGFHMNISFLELQMTGGA